MTPARRLHVQLGLFTLLTTLLGAANWWIEPNKALGWIIGMVTMPVIWAAVALQVRVRSLDDRSEAERRFLALNVVVAGLVIAGALGLSLASGLGAVGGPTVDRVQGIVLGVILVLIGNAIPTVLPPLASEYASRKAQAFQRFAGWCFVVAGLVWTSAFALMKDPGVAGVVGVVALGSGLMVIALRCGYGRLRSVPAGDEG